MKFIIATTRKKENLHRRRSALCVNCSHFWILQVFWEWHVPLPLIRKSLVSLNTCSSKSSVNCAINTKRSHTCFRGGWHSGIFFFFPPMISEGLRRERNILLNPLFCSLHSSLQLFLFYISHKMQLLTGVSWQQRNTHPQTKAYKYLHNFACSTRHGGLFYSARVLSPPHQKWHSACLWMRIKNKKRASKGD